MTQTSRWPTSTLGDLFDIGAGKTLNASARTTTPQHPFLRTANVLWGRVELSEVDTMFYSPEDLRSKTLRPGDLLVCEGGEIGRAAIWRGEIPDCGFQNHLHRLRPKHANVVPAFYMYALQAGFTIHALYEGAGNRTTIPNLSRSRLAGLRVPVPPRQEQKRIAGVLALVQRLIGIERRWLKTTDEMKRSLLQSSFDGPALRHAKRVSLETVARTSSGGTPSRSRPDYYGGPIPWVKSGELNDGFIESTEESLTQEGLDASSAKLFQPGTLLIAMYGATVGKTGILTVQASTNQAICAVIPDSRQADASYLRYHLIADRHVLLNARYGGAQPNISQQIIRAHEIALPGLEEQHAIAGQLEAVDRALVVHTARLRALEDLFRSLLDRLMTGELRLPDVDTLEVLSA